MTYSYKNLVVEPEEGGHFEGLGVNGKIISKFSLRIYNVKAWIGLN
jgi:hypothetical protein